ncbi:MAG: hypothetical protein CMJ78_16980 [Planctomycetaceae bacterium]|nr:hypothetical protein [Planctomycetaceae bacterium]
MDGRTEFMTQNLSQYDRDGFGRAEWSMVLAAVGKSEASDSMSARALDALCRDYWYPLYAYARRRVASIDEAQDLTQSFFARMLERNGLANATLERGPFRAYLITAFRHFMINE